MDYKSFTIFDSEVEKILKGLRVADCMNLLNDPYECDDYEESAVPYNLKELLISDVLTCSYCNVSFGDATEQRNHFKLDWHRYNLKRALSGSKYISEDTFNSLTDDLSSISGSDNEKSDDSDTENQKHDTNLNLKNIQTKSKSNRHSKVFFENDENKILSVYKCLLHSKKENLMKEDLVKKIQDLVEQPKKWMIILLGGGHFASGIFDNNGITHHKTIHCYTVRAKQGGSQYSKDNKGSGQSKSAGASLRRHNEQTLVQSVQEVITSWNEPIKQCSLILYRATGPYNRGVLFGGKNPPLSKTDSRLRNIPFPTRRATFKEVKRVYDILSRIEIYGSAENYRDKFPSSPDKRTISPKKNFNQNLMPDKAKAQTNVREKEIVLKESVEEEFKKGLDKNFSCEENKTYKKFLGIATENVSESDSSEGGNEKDCDANLVYSSDIVCFENLQEYEDTVPKHIKNLKSKNSQNKKTKKSNKLIINLQRDKFLNELEQIHKNLVKSCENKDKELLVENLSIFETLPEKKLCDLEDNSPCDSITKKDFISCLNTPVNNENKSTLLHLAAKNGLPDFVTLLLSSGADPTIKNKSKLTPYVIADKETRNSFKLFAASFPDKYNYKKANIPEPLTDEQIKELESKKKEKKLLKRKKEKLKRKEMKEKKIEEEEKRKFLTLTDRDKCALAAENRINKSSETNLKLSKTRVLSRCFQCGVDISGKTAFEYDYYRFCTITCLKAHRLKTKNYSKEI